MQWGDRSQHAQGQSRPRLVLGALAVLATVMVGATDLPGAVAAPVLFVGLAGNRDTYALVGWIAGGAAVLGAIFWGIGTVASLAVSPELLLAAGIAVGGGLGGVVRLLSGEDAPENPDETVTFTRGAASETRSTPDPRPADLFEESPDPILYFDDSGEGPVVRAVNPAFESVFGVTSAAVEEAALGDAHMVSDRGDAIVRAAGTGAEFRATLDCETADGEVPCSVRLATVRDDVGVRGYVIYTPVTA